MGERDEFEATEVSSARGPALRQDGAAADVEAAEVEAADLEAHVQIQSVRESRDYHLESLLGRGGMGHVHLATDPRVGRRVALKVLHDKLAEHGDHRLRFSQEARLQGRLEHPNIVPVYDVAEDEDGRPFFLMRRVTGLTLSEVCFGLARQEPEFLVRFTTPRLLGIFTQVCLAADYAHSQGVVHRDIKLTNIMVGDFGEVYLLDWGIAKVVAETATEGLAPVSGISERPGTQVGKVLGTPGYMAPEQAQGSPVDARTDVYALGVVLFHLLARRPLHVGNTPDDLLTSSIAGVDARPSVRAPELDVPPELDAICVKATQLRPEDRYASARALQEAVQRVLDGEHDTRLRGKLAARYVRRARRALGDHGAHSVDAERRRAAVRDAGRALALAPDDPDAAELVASLMLMPSDTLPEEVLEESREVSRRQHQQIARTNAYVLWSLAAFLLAAFVGLGIHDWTALLVLVGATAAAGVSLLREERQLWGSVITGFLLSVAIAATGWILGPLWIPPFAALLYISVLTHLHALGSRRVLLVGMALCGAFLPWIASLLGWMGTPYRFQGRLLTIESPAILVDSPFAEPFLAGGIFFALVVISVSLLRGARRELQDREQLHALAWHLKQLAPRAGRSVPPGSPSSAPPLSGADPSGLAEAPTDAPTRALRGRGPAAETGDDEPPTVA